jgi:chaperonin cofactor prefoldin
MTGPETVEQLQQKVARLERQVARCEAQMAVHPEKYDDKKKGQLCRNWIARATFKKERDQAQQELVELKARLEADLAGGTPSIPQNPVIDTPQAILDYVI